MVLPAELMLVAASSKEILPGSAMLMVATTGCLGAACFGSGLLRSTELKLPSCTLLDSTAGGTAVQGAVATGAQAEGGSLWLTAGGAQETAQPL